MGGDYAPPPARSAILDQIVQMLVVRRITDISREHTAIL
jgi:hypothetical protein